MHQDVVDGDAVLANLHHLQAKAVLHEAQLAVFAKHQGLAVLHIDGVARTPFLGVDALMGAVVEDDAVLQDFAHRGSLVGIGGLEHLDGAGGVGGHRAGKEMAACAKAELSGAEGVLHRAVGRRLAHEATGRRGAVLALGEPVDAVVEQNHVQVDVPAVGMDEMVAADGQTVTVAAHLPHGEGRIGHLCACGDGCRTAVDGVHAIGGHVVGQTAAASDAADDGDVLGCHAYFGHGLVQTCQEEVVAASGAPSWLSFLVLLCCVHDSYSSITFFTNSTISLTTKGCPFTSLYCTGTNPSTFMRSHAASWPMFCSATTTLG